MKNREIISEMTVEQLMEMNGGSFAYDVGRILRFIGLSGGGHPVGMACAVAEWQALAMVNEDPNN